MKIIRAVLIFTAAAAYGAQKPPDSTIAAGKQLFAASCSVGYCHGAEGRAGRGPRLRDREWDRAYLFKVIDQGIPNSSMPAWHGKLSTAQINSIIAYILSISKEVDAGASAAASNITAPRSEPVSSAATQKAIAAGKALFFDASNDRNCGVCHKVSGAGGDIGPDLTNIGQRNAHDLAKAILLPPGPSGRFAPVEIRTASGETLQGIVLDSTPSRLRIYDLTGDGPPVLRSFDPSAIQSRQPIQMDSPHAKIAETYTLAQLLDLVTFLKSSAGPAEVRLSDLF
jgi:putative heme-binding domain-containing protein